MMTEVKVDLDELESVYRIYVEEIMNIRVAMDNVDRAVNELRSSAWKTDGADAFFAKYNDSWKNAFKEHLEYLEHLRDCLGWAKSRYARAYDDKIR